MNVHQGDICYNNSDTVSVLIPTYNSELVIEDCLRSIKKQTLVPYEVIVCDGGSTDRTVEIVKGFGAQIVEIGANRSVQRNTAAKHATGEYVVFIDSDMRLHQDVLAECVSFMTEGTSAVVIHEIFVGNGFWAKVRGFERTFYDGVWYLEAARFYRRDLFIKLGGFDARLIGPEDWDLDERIRGYGIVKRTTSPIIHCEGEVSLTSLLSKKAHYSDSFPIFRELHPERAKLSLSSTTRIGLFWTNVARLIRHPILSAGVAILGLGEVMIYRNVIGRKLRLPHSHEKAVD